MHSILAASALLIMAAGCSNIQFNAKICNEIQSDPTQQLPKECYDYSEEKAAKASLPPSKKKQSVQESELEIKRQ